MSPDQRDDSQDFGVWPALFGLGAAALVIWAMFELSLGFV